jgi:hypothetical protein
MTPDERLAERVRFHRDRLGLSKTVLGERLDELGLPGGYRLVQDIEGTRRKTGTPRKLGATETRLLAQALDVDPDELVNGLGILRDPVTIRPAPAVATVTPDEFATLRESLTRAREHT